MPARLDIVGRRFGSLLVLAPDPATTDRGSSRGWIVRCDCGRDEIYPQRRLTRRNGRHEPVRACSGCEAPMCVVCGAKLPSRTPTRVCGMECRTARARATWRGYYYRHADDPDWRERQAKIVRDRRDERMAADPEYAEQQRGRWHRRMLHETAEQTAQRRTRARLAYAANRGAVQAARRARLDSLSAEELARWMERTRAYQRAYQARRRADMTSDPDAHARYRDIMAEYRRRRALMRMMTEAPRLAEIIADAE